MIAEKRLPQDYNYTDVPLLSGNFINATHIQDTVQHTDRSCIRKIYLIVNQLKG
jgi:hypothetical protein